MSSVDPVFTQNLRRIIAPPLIDAGFLFDGRRVFRRVVEAGRVHIADVQVGERFMQRKFTINIAVFDPQQDTGHADAATAREYHCMWPRRQRLGLLVPSRLPVLERLPAVGFLFGRRDKWWPAYGVDGLQQAKEALISYGLPWFKQF